jgi:hypothetical protein
MWRTLPQQGTKLRELRLEGGGRDREVVIIPREGEVLRFPSTPEVLLETVGRVLVRTEALKGSSIRVTFSAEVLTLERAQVEFEGSEIEWDGMWRRARMRSHPWWSDNAVTEVDLDWAMPAHLVITSG